MTSYPIAPCQYLIFKEASLRFTALIIIIIIIIIINKRIKIILKSQTVVTE